MWVHNVPSNPSYSCKWSLSIRNITYLLPKCARNRSSFGFAFPSCPIKVGEGNAHRNSGNYQTLGSLPRSHFCLVTQCSSPRNSYSHSSHIPFQSFYQTTEMTNHLSAKWKWCQFSCKEWPSWFPVTSEMLAPTGQVLLCFHKHWIKYWSFHGKK